MRVAEEVVGTAEEVRAVDELEDDELRTVEEESQVDWLQ